LKAIFRKETDEFINQGAGIPEDLGREEDKWGDGLDPYRSRELQQS
jgi:hypothetical protein